MANRIAELAAKGMVFDDPPDQQVVDRINALSDADYTVLRDNITSQLSTPPQGPTLYYKKGGFQLRSFEK